MAHVLKIIRGSVKALSLLVMLAFVLNSVNGIFGAMDLADGGVQIQDIDPDDFRIKYDDLHVEVGLNLENNGIYPINDVLLGVKFELRIDNESAWETVLDRNSTEMDSATPIPATGDTIAVGESLRIEVSADMDLFALNTTEIGELFNLTAPWDVADLFDVGFEARMTLTFTISYALDQFGLKFEILVIGEDVEKGF
ncbi:hypothetical protein NEF87_003310 [Candidatus Lokiarchaeum ossiferum]|uniref:Uncharacterized protein n=1 Tax=Candidatus Lokiarchaeum ossiferum TaxID=2951803 RepID=A0ABY6HU25_9ARCH|nr:hypothetical protein NEF87_003310 [Candidatus Lokiarchaeum sp. B-35]